MFYINSVDAKGVATFADLYKCFNMEHVKPGILQMGMQLKPIMYNDIMSAVIAHTPRTGRMKKYTYAQAFEAKDVVTIRLGVMVDRFKSDSPFYTPFLEEGTAERILRGRSRNKKKYPHGTRRGVVKPKPYIFGESMRWEGKLSQEIPETIKNLITKGTIHEGP